MVQATKEQGVPVARFSACEIARHMSEQPFMAVCGVIPVAVVVPVFTAGTCWHYRGTTTVKNSKCEGLP